MEIGYKYNYRNFLGFSTNEGAVSTKPGDTYLSSFTDTYYNVSIFPVVFTHYLVRYFNACNEIDNQNMMFQSDLVLEKYWVTHSGYFRLATTVALGMGITDGKILLCRGISEESVGKKISTR